MADEHQRWSSIADESFGLMFTLSNVVRTIYQDRSDSLPDLRQAPTIFIASDYSGQHRSSSYDTISFLLASSSSVLGWLTQAKDIRQRFLKDTRRMSYKRLSDRLRTNALIPFLNSSNRIEGALISVLINKDVDPLFDVKDGKTLDDDEKKLLSRWKPPVAEKMLRVVHFVSHFLAGLSRTNQNVLWVTDEDEIAPNDEGLTDLTTVFAHVSSHYLDHTLGQLSIATTASDPGDQSLEDFVAIPDLAAGALTEAIIELNQALPSQPQGLLLPMPPETSPKTKLIVQWFAHSDVSLKRMVFVIDPSPNPGKVIIKNIDFEPVTVRV